MKAFFSRARLCLPVVPVMLTAAGAHANPNDALRLTASYSVTRDDNLFLLTNKSAAQALVGRSTPAETIKAATAGLQFQKDYGLQRINLRASAVNYDYQNFSYLSFSALNYNGQFDWKLTPRFRGTLLTLRDQALNTFGDFRNFSVRNQRTTTYSSALGTYELDGAWQLVGGVSRIDLRNEATIIEQRGFTLNSADIGLRRTFSSGSELTYRMRRGSGDYDDVSFGATGFLPTRYDQTEHELQLLWSVTAKSRLDTRISYLDKKFNRFDFRDYSGVQASSTFDWGLTARTRLRVGVSRDLNDFQTLYSNYGTVDKITLLPTWQIKEKLALSLRHEFLKRRFQGSVPGGLGGLSGVQRQDEQQLTRLTLEWSPREFIDVSAWLQRNTRDSNFSGLTYTSNSVGVLAQVSF